jgi:hypothetical protein
MVVAMDFFSDLDLFYSKCAFFVYIGFYLLDMLFNRITQKVK